MARAFRPAALALARAASQKKGDHIALLHAGRSSPVADYLLIVTALSGAHLEALEREVEKAASAMRIRLLRRARPKSDQWRVLDFGGLIVHLMLAQTREFYALEKLNHGAPRVRWEENGRGPKARPIRRHAHA